MRTYPCTCGNTLYFDNTQCLRCGSAVGWCPECSAIAPLVPGQTDGAWQCGQCGAVLALCHNYAVEAVCNRCVPVGAAGGLCDCCVHNEVIPDLSVEGHRERWAELEGAKRRVFHSLDLLGLPRGRPGEDGLLPLTFDFKADALPDAGLWRPTAGDEKVYTGHAGGKITINVKEADTVEREKLRVDLNESHRTLIGHFRHEIGHYYWEVLVRNRDEARSVQMFGDHENPSYADALERYYAEGPRPDWPGNYISAYASMHPWEDFAETFAHYLDMVSVLDTAIHLGLTSAPPREDLDAQLEAFRVLGLALNELNREMGLLDLVPEVPSPAVVEKLRYVHGLCMGSNGQD
ncbi:hypothetical protein B1C78_11915 [Thioalkalivibrio denitrificans]|uniref:4Fe-4S ferredoxin-type domain-containing protein n=1 Tax=Thioalkalivibrio denitrificans TaxID=108003 RepID=A0A1V3NEE8_9GAMM|nr:putative zinc-binding metallopeptidase [Thioalkalivibrio denitrificans]OOG23258.1 hypothetical protein B1C78_11915 [Thioalkalivibrio denitrificans]